MARRSLRVVRFVGESGVGSPTDVHCAGAIRVLVLHGDRVRHADLDHRRGVDGRSPPTGWRPSAAIVRFVAGRVLPWYVAAQGREFIAHARLGLVVRLAELAQLCARFRVDLVREGDPVAFPVFHVAVAFGLCAGDIADMLGEIDLKVGVLVRTQPLQLPALGAPLRLQDRVRLREEEIPLARPLGLPAEDERRGLVATLDGSLDLEQVSSTLGAS